MRKPYMRMPAGVSLLCRSAAHGACTGMGRACGWLCMANLTRPAVRGTLSLVPSHTAVHRQSLTVPGRSRLLSAIQSACPADADCQLRLGSCTFSQACRVRAPHPCSARPGPHPDAIQGPSAGGAQQAGGNAGAWGLLKVRRGLATGGQAVTWSTAYGNDPAND